MESMEQARYVSVETYWNHSYISHLPNYVSLYTLAINMDDKSDASVHGPWSRQHVQSFQVLDFGIS